MRGLDSFWLFASVLLLATVALFYLAVKGNIWAIGVMVSVWTIFCVIVGALIVGYVVKIQSAKEQENFILNAKENLQVVQNQQRLQNMQAESLMKQLGQASRLQMPEPENAFIIDSDVFSELD